MCPDGWANTLAPYRGPESHGTAMDPGMAPGQTKSIKGGHLFHIFLYVRSVVLGNGIGGVKLADVVRYNRPFPKHSVRSSCEGYSLIRSSIDLPVQMCHRPIVGTPSDGASVYAAAAMLVRWNLLPGVQQPAVLDRRRERPHAAGRDGAEAAYDHHDQAKKWSFWRERL